MAALENATGLSKLAIGSYMTALCVIPPAHFHQDIDRLRALYDKAHGKWPAHINILYPFVAIENLPRAIDLIRSQLLSLGPDSRLSNIQLRLDTSDYFSHRRSNTIFIAPSDEGGGQSLKYIRSVILEGFKHGKNDQDYRSHLTIGQSPANAPPLREYLLDKAKLLLPIEWRLDGLAILVREWTTGQYNDSSEMKIWGTVNLSGDMVLDAGSSLAIRKMLQIGEESLGKEERQTFSGCPMETIHAPRNSIDPNSGGKNSRSYPNTTYQFSAATNTWKPMPSCYLKPTVLQLPTTLTISSYNILHDLSLHTPTEDRYPILLASLLSHSALGDILILQEVTDDFLSYILRHEVIQNHYSFSTHAPPDQDGIGPLRSFHNVVALSRWRFGWEWLPFDSRHKGAVVLRFETVGKCRDEGVYPLLVAGVHLTSGLTDGAVAAKKLQLQTLVGHLSKNCSKNPWIIAGDFNITTSKFAIEEAVKMKYISLRTASDIVEIETILASAGLVDSWIIANSETEGIEWLTGGYEDLYEGEEGATFNPMMNSLAAQAVKRNSNNMRPQRYDRILVNGEGLIEVIDFNMFGFLERGHKAADLGAKDQDVDSSCGSDHWGIRSTMRIDSNLRKNKLDNTDIYLALLQLRKAPSSLSENSALNISLTEHDMFPTDEEVHKRNEIFTMVKNLLQQSRNQGSGDIADDNQFDIPLVVVPVGSYGLGVWSTYSDIDILCIGCTSSKAFFTLVMQKLNKSRLGIRVLRKVNAASGTMLELEFKGVKLDLQYCPARKIAERWPEVTQLPPTDQAFDLSILSLTKLNSFRDLNYLQRTIPDLVTFCTAQRFTKTWAKQRGIYGSRFGYLGGFHITLLLSRICKLLARNTDAVAVADIICTFFHHYASFDWSSEMVVDPDLYKTQMRYRRSRREAMVILSVHAPRVNVARTASLPSARTVIEELKRVDGLLSEASVTWRMIIGDTAAKEAMTDLTSGEQEFLKSYKSYIKINAQFWGASLAKGSSLLGWLESKCVVLLIDINRKLPGVHARIWPARFKPRDDGYANDNAESDYQGCYLIGLKAKADSTSGLKRTDLERKLDQHALRASLEHFTDQIRGDEKYFDPKSSWVDVVHVRQAELGDLELDERDWGVYAAQDNFDIDEVAVEEIALEVDYDSDDEATAKSSAKTKPKIQSSSNKKAQPKLVPVPTAKLRPATDVLSRLRWDPNINSNDYLVGYIDRFLGTKEIGLDNWKREQTDEEFIPQHRIVYFKRKSDGIMMWDRETRRDEVFGSGANTAASSGAGVCELKK